MYLPEVGVSRFGKSTYISMISNSVAHLRSYTNSAIAGISTPISPETPRRYRWKLPADIAKNSAAISPCRAPMIPHQAQISSHQMASVRDVSQCFKSVS